MNHTLRPLSALRLLQTLGQSRSGRAAHAPLASALLASAVLAMPGTIVPAAQAQVATSDDLKAALVFNILRYVDFPPARAARPMALCVDRRSSGAGAMAALGGRSLGTRPIALRMVDGAPDRACDVLVTGPASAAELARLRQAGTLVIGDGGDFTANGGAIGLVKSGPQIRFDVNLPASREAGVTISSRLLRLAARVRQ